MTPDQEAGLGEQDAPHLAKFGLLSEPFTGAAGPNFFYADANREQRLDLMQHLAPYSEVLIVIGGPGAGKTMLLQQFIARAGETWRTAVVSAHPGMAGAAFTAAVMHAFGLPMDASIRRARRGAGHARHGGQDSRGHGGCAGGHQRNGTSRINGSTAHTRGGTIEPTGCHARSAARTKWPPRHRQTLDRRRGGRARHCRGAAGGAFRRRKGTDRAHRLLVLAVGTSRGEIAGVARSVYSAHPSGSACTGYRDGHVTTHDRGNLTGHNAG